MKIVFKLIVLLIILQSCSKEKTSIEKRPWINIKNGEIFEIINDSIFITEYFSKSKQGYAYNLNNNRISINDSLFGIIQSVNEDSLILYSDSSFHNISKNIYIPISQFQINTNKEELLKLLIENPWELNYKGINLRFDFTNKEASQSQFFQAFVTETKDSLNELADLKWWTLKEYNGQFIAVLSDYNFMYIRFIQLSQITDSSIEADINYYNLYKLEKPISGIAINKINKDRNLEITREFLSNSSWKLNDYKIIAKNKELFNGQISEFEPKEKDMPLPRIQSKIHGIKRIYESDYLNKSFRYSFDSNMNGFLLANQDTLRRGFCNISIDGMIILTDPYSFLPNAKIIELNKNSLIIEKAVRVNFEDDRFYEKWYVREKYERN